jgi:hypothetical protein
MQGKKNALLLRRLHRERRFRWSRSRMVHELVQTERTLDEAHFPSLQAQALKTRNHDQVVSREYRSIKTGKTIATRGQPILMVSQLWIWKLGEYALSASTSPPLNHEVQSGEVHSQHLDTYPMEYPIDYVFEAADHGQSEPFAKTDYALVHLLKGEVPDLVIGILIARQIARFGEAPGNGSASVLDLFESGVVRVMSAVDVYMAAGSSAKLDIEQEAQFIHHVSDIREELAMIETVLHEQETILESMMRNASREARNHQAWQMVRAAQVQLGQYEKRLHKIDSDAQRIEKRIQDQLNLKRTHASLQDTRTSLLLGTAVIGFTVITVIFTPLTFMTGLFSMPIDKLTKHKHESSSDTLGDAVYSSSYVGGWFSKQALSPSRSVDG